MLLNPPGSPSSMRTRIVVYDLDGTLIRNTEFVWKTLHEAIGTQNEKRKRAMELFRQGKISYAEWARHDVELWVEKGVTKSDILTHLSSLALVEDCIETIVELKKRGVLNAVISGSIDTALEALIPGYDSLFDFVFINRLVFSDKGRLEGIIPTPYDFAHKALALREIMAQTGIRRDETAFVGDHDNDVEIAKLAGTSIAFNSKSKALDSVADVKLKGESLREILPFLP